MKILFIHQNFPGQYLHLARHLGASPKNEVIFITQRQDATIPGVKKIVYKPQRAVTPGIHHYLGDTEAGILNAQEVARIALDLKASGFVPDVMLGHNGWGEIWYLKDVFPNTPLLGYFEFFYRSQGADVGFDPKEQLTPDTSPRLRTKNVGNLLALEAVDWGQCPTQWQRSVYPLRYQPILSVVHEGIDTQVVAPDHAAHFAIPGTDITLKYGDEVVTYVARNLEPYRGFPSFMRSLPTILQSRPKAHVLIVGGEETSYGHRLPAGETFRQRMLDELGDAIDLKRVHFLNKVPYSTFLKILQISRAHVYLTYPFVLSWSMLEAMSAGCLVIGSRTPPVEEVIQDGINGILVDFFSPDEIAQHVVEALEDVRKHEELRRNARRTIVHRYDLRTICLPAQLSLVEKLAL
ncbi:glycosyltransferase family 4 protein [Collimonas sp.]|jgi:glycosyltransferase involved in cell wall biosynthesis|uniref:glycosyltransferase family 4 protein n=1 Tax=Collimonas sp. TaxID=1963772 RepID=UPI002BCD3F68|nr:glycosyltransferase family 4 protein [Collimonas sp.]HWW04221.1 glycosyltransferase family 4 protein [Collimonas sp.]